MTLAQAFAHEQGETGHPLFPIQGFPCVRITRNPVAEVCVRLTPVTWTVTHLASKGSLSLTLVPVAVQEVLPWPLPLPGPQWSSFVTAATAFCHFKSHSPLAAKGGSLYTFLTLSTAPIPPRVYI